MFFSRYWRDKIEAVESRSAVNTADITALLARLQERDRLLELHQEALKSFQKVADAYTEGLQRARQTIEELQATPPPVFRANMPLHKSEEEEDLEFQLDAGVINLEEFNERLRELGVAD